MAKRGNGLGGTPVEIPRKGRPSTWGVRTPLHLNPATGKKERHWIGREYGTKTEAEKALRKWHPKHEGETFRLYDWRGSKITNDLDNHENPVEVSANARHHSPGYTMARYGRRRAEGAKKLAASSAGRIGLASLV
ncbi:hypothetical protein AB0O31_18380 [Kitasatospora cineracea]|uniref:hypothetical protein n=1 Tax=Kitasatospora cineracea TaxID=88074 RepID=UPI0034352089